MKRIFSCALILLAFSYAAFAQYATLKEAKDIKPDFLHDFFTPAPGSFIVLDYAEPHSMHSLNRKRDSCIYTIYDSNLDMKYSETVEGLRKKVYLGGLEKPGAIHVFYEDKLEVLSVGLDLNTGQFAGTPVSLYKKQDVGTTYSRDEKIPYDLFYRGYSADSNYAYAMSYYPKKDDQYIDGVIFNKEMKVIKSFSIKLDELSYTFHRIFVQQNNEGTIFIESAVRLKKSRKLGFVPYAWMVTEIDKNGQSVSTFLDDLPEGRFDHMAWQITEKGIAFSGLRVQKSGEGYISHISGEYNSWRKKMSNLREITIAESPLYNTILDPQRKNTKLKGLPYCYDINSFFAKDGTHYIVMQEQGPLTGIYGTNIYALSFTPGQEINWMKRIEVSKFPLEDMYTGCTAASKENEGVFIFYNDYEKNIDLQPDEDGKRKSSSKRKKEQKVPFVSNIKPDGTLSTHIAGNYSDAKYLLENTKPTKFSGNEFIFTSFRYRNSGNSTYKIGVISIK